VAEQHISPVDEEEEEKSRYLWVEVCVLSLSLSLSSVGRETSFLQLGESG